MEELGKRAQKSRVHKPYQLMGLEIAALLNDVKHRALYIKLAKKFGGDKLLPLVKNIAENKNVRNKGGYFMKVLYSNGDRNPQRQKEK